MLGIGLWRKWARDRRGSSAIEFAFIVPTLLILHIASQDVALAFAFDRKLDNCVAAMGDLVAQISVMDKSSVSEVFAAGNAMLQSKNGSKLGFRLSVVSIESSDTGIVTWSIVSSDKIKPYVKGTKIRLSTNLSATKETNLIFADALYDYQSMFGKFGLDRAFQLSASSVARSRGSRLENCTDCN